MSLVSLTVSNADDPKRGDSLDTVKRSEQDHLSVPILAHRLDVFPQVLENLFSVLQVSAVLGRIQVTYLGGTSSDQKPDDSRSIFSMDNVG